VNYKLWLLKNSISLWLGCPCRLGHSVKGCGACIYIPTVKEDLDKALFDLILRGFEIVQIVPTLADGYTVGYTVIYKDNK
jgi:hypothetical protein